MGLADTVKPRELPSPVQARVPALPSDQRLESDGLHASSRPMVRPKVSRPLQSSLNLSSGGNAHDHHRSFHFSTESDALSVASSTASSSSKPRNPINRNARYSSADSASFALKSTPVRLSQPSLPVTMESRASRRALSFASDAASSKSNQVAQRERRKAKEAVERDARVAALEADASRTGPSLSPLEISELRSLGFYSSASESDVALPDGLGEGLLASRKDAVRGVRTKELNGDGAEASLSQTLAYWRMRAVHHTVASLFSDQPAPLALSDVCSTLRRIETRLERGHALLAFVASLHR